MLGRVKSIEHAMGTQCSIVAMLSRLAIANVCGVLLHTSIRFFQTASYCFQSFQRSGADMVLNSFRIRRSRPFVDTDGLQKPQNDGVPLCGLVGEPSAFDCQTNRTVGFCFDQILALQP